MVKKAGEELQELDLASRGSFGVSALWTVLGIVVCLLMWQGVRIAGAEEREIQIEATPEAPAPESAIPQDMPVQLSGTINPSETKPKAEGYSIPVLVGNQKQGMAEISPREEQRINQLLKTSKNIGLIRLASILAAQGEGFNAYTWKSVFLVYGPTRRDECRVKIQKSHFLADIKHCQPVGAVKSVQYAYIKYNNWDVAINQIFNAIERGIQFAGIALPLSFKN